MQARDGSLVTYDCFPYARVALRALERRVLPPVIASLTCALNEPDRYVVLKKLARSSAGRTPSGATIHDIRMELKGEMYASQAILQPELATKLQDVSQRASRLNQRAADFFSLGVGEEDQLKKFLTTVRLKVEQNQLVGQQGWLHARAIGLQGA